MVEKALTFTVEEDISAGTRVEVNPKTGMLRAARPISFQSYPSPAPFHPSVFQDLIDQEYRKRVEQENDILRTPEWRTGAECEQWGGRCPEILKEQFHLHSTIDPRTVYFPPKGSHYLIRGVCHIFINAEGMGLECRVHKREVRRA